MRFFLFLLLFPIALFAENTLSRRLIGFWDSKADQSIDTCIIHRNLELPLNYLGFDVLYYDIQEPLPDLSNRKDVAGIIICFQGNTIGIKNPIGFINWVLEAMADGKKVVIMDNPGFTTDEKGIPTPTGAVNQIYEKIGFYMTDQSIDYTFDYTISSESNELIPFEREYPSLLPAFSINRVNHTRAKSYLRVAIPGRAESESDLIIIGPGGGYVSQDYASNSNAERYDENPRELGWYINPFRFFALIFNTEVHPIPDTTTLAGRRIFYSFCDCDAFNFSTEIEAYRQKNLPCSAVILDKIIKPYPEIPVSIAIVAADVDPNWVGTKKSQQIAREYFALPQVEAATHTYSHPFDWRFFETGGPEREINFLYLYPYGSWQNVFLSWFRAKYYQEFRPEEYAKIKLKYGYITPRAYANKPFNLEREIGGSVEYLNQFSPPDNQVALMCWSGDAEPWDTPVALCKKAGIKNQGGGDVRLDPEYPSIIFVSPLGRKPGGWIQIYASDSAEISYTDGWKKRFFGFRYLPVTLNNTNVPRRIKPIALYYHSYSGQFMESVNAIISNIEYIKTQEIIPIRTTRFCEIGEGFYSVELERIGDAKWKILNRKGLQTLRIDKATNLKVDLANSRGVIGFNKYRGSLYIYLDAYEQEPVVQIGERNQFSDPYLQDSSWEIWKLKREEGALSFLTKGWGKLSMRWQLPNPGRYKVIATPENGVPTTLLVTSEDSSLPIELDLPYDTLVKIKLNRESKNVLTIE